MDHNWLGREALLLDLLEEANDVYKANLFIWKWNYFIIVMFAQY